MRVVSLVPSLTEAVALTGPSMLVGATDYCTHPAGLDVARVGGSKYPDLAKVLALRPDLVLMNEEENRLADAEALRAAGVAVHVTFPRTVPEALEQLGELMAVLGLSEPVWLDEARVAWAAVGEPESLVRAVIPVWRRPWIVLGEGTFAGDVLARLGVVNVFGGGHPELSDGAPAGGQSGEPPAGGQSGGAPAGGQSGAAQAGGGQGEERYPRPSLEEIRAAGVELVILPDEPYAFSRDDGPEAFPGTPIVLVSGRLLTWHGPSLAEAARVLPRQLAAR